MRYTYKILLLLVITLTLSGCNASSEVVLANKVELLERDFKEFKYEDKDAYISPESDYVTIMKDDEIDQVFFTESNVTLFNDESGIYISNDVNLKLYKDKCYVDDNEYEIKSKECKKSNLGNNLSKYLKKNMPDVIK